MNPLTPEQTQQLKTWAQQRDEALLALSDATQKKEVAVKEVSDLSASKTALLTDISVLTGRKIELQKQDNDAKQVISKELSDLKVEKTTLQTEISALKVVIENSEAHKASTIASTAAIVDAHERVYARTGALERTILHVVAVARENETTIDALASKLKNHVQEIVDKSTVHVANLEKAFGHGISTLTKWQENLAIPTKKIKD